MTGEGAEARSWSRLGRRLQAFLVSQFLLVSYLIAITVALAWPEPGRAVGSVKVRRPAIPAPRPACLWPPQWPAAGCPSLPLPRRRWRTTCGWSSPSTSSLVRPRAAGRGAAPSRRPRPAPLHVPRTLPRPPPTHPLARPPTGLPLRPPAVFFITGLVLHTDELLVALRQRLGVLWGFLSILAITPCLAFAFREIPLSPPAFAAGARSLLCPPC